LKGARRQRVLPFKEEGEGKGKKKGILKAVADKAGDLFKGEKK